MSKFVNTSYSYNKNLSEIFQNLENDFQNILNQFQIKSFKANPKHFKLIILGRNISVLHVLNIGGYGC